MTIVIGLLLLISVICDAIRDAWVVRAVDWWQWHLIKWIGFYTPHMLIVSYYLYINHWGVYDFAKVAAFAVLCWCAWRLAYDLARSMSV